MMGRLHSVETLGAVDGPGIRTVFFFQGCPARCIYCHNPDTWNLSGGREITVEEIVDRAKRSAAYYGTDGGVTFSGGEPLLQGRFLTEAVCALKEAGIKSAIDTSGTYFDEFSREAIEAMDLVLLDIKHTDADQFKELTGREQSALFKVIACVNALEKPVWARQVILPGYNDNEEYIEALNGLLRQIKTIKKTELLGYHNMAESKYERLGRVYKLKGMDSMSEERLEQLRLLVK